MLETQEIRNLILKELPILLQNDTAFRDTLLEIARPHFADKLETEHRFEEIIARFGSAIEKNTLAIEKLNQRLDQKIVEDRKRFDALEFRLEKLEQRFEKLEQRLEKLELRFEKLEQRLDLKIAEDRKRFDALELRLENMEQRFEQKIVEDRKRFDALELRLENLEQRFEQKIVEDRNRWEKNDKQWEENHNRWEKNDKQWEDNHNRWEKNDKQWEENRRWQKKQEIATSKLEQRLMAMGARWGTDSEAAFRNGLAAILTEISDIEVIHVDERDEEGIVFGYPEEIELDIIIKNGLLIVVEMKSSTDKSDVYRFDKKVHFYEKKQGRKANKKMIISPMVHEKAKPVAKNLGVEIYTYVQEMAL